MVLNKYLIQCEISIHPLEVTGLACQPQSRLSSGGAATCLSSLLPHKGRSPNPPVRLNCVSSAMQSKSAHAACICLMLGEGRQCRGGVQAVTPQGHFTGSSWVPPVPGGWGARAGTRCRPEVLECGRTAAARPALPAGRCNTHCQQELRPLKEIFTHVRTAVYSSAHCRNPSLPHHTDLSSGQR